ncbi:MAG: 2'-deoxycytidine 5'-triphosphate deaminase [Alphaproteobacteria bacterium]|nr:2'-deoxycytidine 5'-triphosphate deaminase [Alphaproteobacteria bacterium]
MRGAPGGAARGPGAPALLYGAGIGSSYQGQELRLSKHFREG